MAASITLSTGNKKYKRVIANLEVDGVIVALAQQDGHAWHTHNSLPSRSRLTIR